MKKTVVELDLVGYSTIVHFDGPDTADCVGGLRQAPTIPGVTDPFVGLSEHDWEFSLTSLKHAKLLAVNQAEGSDELIALDSHALQWEYFARQLRKQQPDLVAKADAEMQAARAADANFSAECCTPRFSDAQGSWKETGLRGDIPKPTWVECLLADHRCFLVDCLRN